MDEPIRILQVGDVPTVDAIGASDGRFQVDSVARADAALEHLETAAVDCLVSGYELPDSDGIELLEAVRADFPDLPFVLVTGAGDESVASEAISAGVTDYIRPDEESEPAAALEDRVEQAVVRDRTERDRTAMGDRMRALFRMIPEPIAHVSYEDGEPMVLSVNPAFEETFGYHEAEAVGESVNDLIVPPKQASDARTVDDRVREAGAIRREVRRRTTDGVGDFIFRTVPVDDADRSDEYFGVYTDISEQKAIERALQRQNERLDEFVGTVSHDLQGPLTVADYHLSEAAEDDGDHIESASLAIDRMDALIDDLLTLARSGTEVETVEPVDLAALARTCWRTVDATDATLEVADEVTVRADATRLRQLLENLLRNAVEHGSASPPAQARADAVERGSTSPPSQAPEDPVEHGSNTDRPDDADRRTDDGGPVTVTIGELDDATGFYVADDGSGVPEDERDRIFERGYSTSIEGTGFGLAIVREAAAAHGWTVSVTGSDAGGARFEVTGVDVLE